MFSVQRVIKKNGNKKNILCVFLVFSEQKIVLKNDNQTSYKMIFFVFSNFFLKNSFQKKEPKRLKIVFLLFSLFSLFLRTKGSFQDMKNEKKIDILESYIIEHVRPQKPGVC